jgi:hypothetical protein
MERHYFSRSGYSSLLDFLKSGFYLTFFISTPVPQAWTQVFFIIPIAPLNIENNSPVYFLKALSISDKFTSWKKSSVITSPKEYSHCMEESKE